MTDQQRYDCLGCNGNEIIKTPNIDRLAKQSANFTSFFVQAPVCVPSRQTFFTGRYPRHHKNRVNYTSMNDDMTLVQNRLQKEGYKTGFVGKLHYFPPTKEYALSTGFDCGMLHDAGPTDKYSDYITWLKEHVTNFDSKNYRVCRRDVKNPYVTLLPEKYHETTWCGEKTRETLKSFAETDEPFFLFSSYWKPHSPFEIPYPWATMYDDADIELHERVDEEYINKLPPPVKKLALRGGDHYKLSREEILWKYRAYYGAISQIDNQVGLTLKKLDDYGLSDNTMVIFCSDHGDMMFAHGMMGKNIFFDEAIHAPFMIKYPGKVKPGIYDDLIESTDVLSTVFDLCGIQTPYENEGKSFAKLLSEGNIGSEYIPREYVFAENIIPEVHTGGFDFSYEKGKGIKGIRHPDAKMVRSRKWKYNYYIDYEELYDLENDPNEMKNLAGMNEYNETIAGLRKELLDWMITSDEADQIATRWYHVKNEDGKWAEWSEWEG